MDPNKVRIRGERKGVDSLNRDKEQRRAKTQVMSALGIGRPIDKKGHGGTGRGKKMFSPNSLISHFFRECWGGEGEGAAKDVFRIWILKSRKEGPFTSNSLKCHVAIVMETNQQGKGKIRQYETSIKKADEDIKRRWGKAFRSPRSRRGEMRGRSLISKTEKKTFRPAKGGTVL